MAAGIGQSGRRVLPKVAFSLGNTGANPWQPPQGAKAQQADKRRKELQARGGVVTPLDLTGLIRGPEVDEDVVGPASEAGEPAGMPKPATATQQLGSICGVEPAHRGTRPEFDLGAASRVMVGAVEGVSAGGAGSGVSICAIVRKMRRLTNTPPFACVPDGSQQLQSADTNPTRPELIQNVPKLVSLGVEASVSYAQSRRERAASLPINSPRRDAGASPDRSSAFSPTSPRSTSLPSGMTCHAHGLMLDAVYLSEFPALVCDAVHGCDAHAFCFECSTRLSVSVGTACPACALAVLLGPDAASKRARDRMFIADATLLTSALDAARVADAHLKTFAAAGASAGLSPTSDSEVPGASGTAAPCQSESGFASIARSGCVRRRSLHAEAQPKRVRREDDSSAGKCSHSSHHVQHAKLFADLAHYCSFIDNRLSHRSVSRAPRYSNGGTFASVPVLVGVATPSRRNTVAGPSCGLAANVVPEARGF